MRRRVRFKSNKIYKVVEVVLLFFTMTVGYAYLERQLNGSININVAKYELSGAKSLIKKASTDTNLTYASASATQKKEMFKFSDTDYRYIGENPNNYIVFNSEMWRIVGVFDRKIKLIKDYSLGTHQYDYKASGIGTSTSANGSNDWSDAELMYMLNISKYKNGNIYYPTKSGYSYSNGVIKKGSQVIYKEGCRPFNVTTSTSDSYDCTSASTSWSLNKVAMDLVEDHAYNLPAFSTSSLSSDTAYTTEKSGDSWTGKVGLLYPSDYFYTYGKGIDSTCQSNISSCNGSATKSWLYTGEAEYSLAKTTSNTYTQYIINTSGALGTASTGTSSTLTVNVRPVVYLKNDVSIIDGTGEISNPYRITQTAGDILIQKANAKTVTTYTGKTGEMYAFNHPQTEQTSQTTDYRYIGSAPNNYITFNGEDDWRVIGVVDGKVKLIRTNLRNMIFSWDKKENGVGSCTVRYYGSNDWSDSQLMFMLNSYKYQTLTDSTFQTSQGTYTFTKNTNLIRDKNNRIVYKLGCSPTKVEASATEYDCSSNSWELNSMALSIVEESKYYLGGINHSSSTSGPTYFNAERGVKTVSSVIRSKNWIGKVGLMYPSDYVYTYANGVDNTCYNTTPDCRTDRGENPNSGWLYSYSTKFTITSLDFSPDAVIYMHGEGFFADFAAANGGYVMPVVYLSPDVLLSKSGTSSDKYCLTTADGSYTTC